FSGVTVSPSFKKTPKEKTVLESFHVVAEGDNSGASVICERLRLFRHILLRLAGDRSAVGNRLRPRRTERNFDIFVAQQTLGFYRGARIFLDDVAGLALQVHDHGQFPVRLRRQVDLLHRSLVNSAYANFGSVVETGNVLKFGVQAVGGTEQKVLVADQKDANG